MTNRIALLLALIVIALVVVDARVFDWGYSVFALKQLTVLTEYIAFWR